MKFSVLTLFPDMIRRSMEESIIGRAQKNGIISLETYQIRDYSQDKHRRVDDYPFGGGGGMIMKCQPIFDCYQDLLKKNNGQRPYTVYVSPRGSVLTQKKAKELSEYSHLAILCGHYEGIDQRVLDTIIDEEISIGDYVLTGGELPACVLIDCISRMIPGVLSEESSYTNESHYNGLLEHPQYTQPRLWNGLEVPPVLTEGNHRFMSVWKTEKSIEMTKKMRPDLIRNPIPTGKRIRFFEPDDRAAFLEMMNAFYSTPGVLHTIPLQNGEKTFDAILNKDPYVNAYMIRYEQKDAGYCLLSHTYSNEGGGLTVWFEEIYIKPDFRGHKLAYRAMKEIMELYEDCAARFRLEVTEENESAKKIYRRLGFKPLHYEQMIKD